MKGGLWFRRIQSLQKNWPFLDNVDLFLEPFFKYSDLSLVLNWNKSSLTLSEKFAKIFSFQVIYKSLDKNIDFRNLAH